MWGSAQTTAPDERNAQAVQVASFNTPLDLDVSFDAGAFTDENPPNLAEGLRSFFTQGEFCDVLLRAGDGETFAAHAVVMGTLSGTFRDRLKEAATAADKAAAVEEAGGNHQQQTPAEDSVKEAAAATTSAQQSTAASAAASTTDTAVAPALSAATAAPTQTATTTSIAPDAASEEAVTVTVSSCGGRPELKLDRIMPEAVKSMLNFAYGASESYAPSSDEVNQHVLKLAAEFDIAGLRDCASDWLIRDLNSSNVVQRLATCTEFDLKCVYEAIIEELVQCPFAVAGVSNDMKIMQQPRLLQDLLVRMVRCHADKTTKISNSSASTTEEAAVEKPCSTEATSVVAAGTTNAPATTANAPKAKANGLKSSKSGRMRSSIAEEIDPPPQGKRQRAAAGA
jgi:hypothetical protein